MKKKGRIGSSFDDFLIEDGSYAEVTPRAIKRVIARQIDALMADEGLSKTELAKRMKTSRAQLGFSIRKTSPLRLPPSRALHMPSAGSSGWSLCDLKPGPRLTSLLPLWEKVARTQSATDEGSLPAEADPSSVHDASHRGHLLPQGEKGEERRVCHRCSGRSSCSISASRCNCSSRNPCASIDFTVDS